MQWKRLWRVSAKIRDSERGLHVARHEGQDIRFYRPKGFDAYVILFRVTDDAVIILRVLHGSQDIDAALGET